MYIHIYIYIYISVEKRERKRESFKILSVLIKFNLCFGLNSL